MRPRLLFVIGLLWACAACATEETPASDASAAADAGADAGPKADAGPLADAGSGADAGPSADASPGADAGPLADAGPSDAGRPDGGTGTGVCAGLPCRDRISSDQDFDTIARESNETLCQFDREILFLTPKSSAAPVQATYYIDGVARRYVLDFVRTDLAGAYTNIDVDQFFKSFVREDMNEYWIGRIRRLTPVSGQPIHYAVDLQRSGAWGSLTAPEVAPILTQLAATFQPPLGYGPSSYSAIREAENFSAPGFDLALPGLCPGEGCTPGAGPCLVVPTGAELCGQFVENRDIQAEHSHRMRVTLTPGNYRLSAGQMIGLFDGGEYGPGRVSAQAAGDGTVIAQDVGGTLYWSVQQNMSAGSDQIGLELSIYTPSEPLVFREPYLDNVGVFGTVNGGVGSDDRVQLESCTGSGHAQYFAEADLGGGDRLRFEYRYQLPFAGSGPLFPIAADITLGGQSLRVEGYFDVLYAGVHHNWNNNFWFLFGAPINYQGHPVYGLWIDEPGFGCCPPDSIRTMDANLQGLDTLSATYMRAPVGF